jgi:hypothetical protein
MADSEAAAHAAEEAAVAERSPSAPAVDATAQLRSPGYVRLLLLAALSRNGPWRTPGQLGPTSDGHRGLAVPSGAPVREVDAGLVDGMGDPPPHDRCVARRHAWPGEHRDAGPRGREAVEGGTGVADRAREARLARHR